MKRNTHILILKQKGDKMMGTFKLFVCFLLFVIPAIVVVAQPEETATVQSDTLTTEPETDVERIKREILELYPGMDFGREVDEPTTVRWLFKEDDNVRELLGLHPRFVYNPKDKPDPMVIPWIRREIMAKELLNEALTLLNQRKLHEARKLLAMIVENYKESKSYAQAVQELEKVDKTMQQQPGITDTQPQIVLPPWIYDNIKGIIFDPDMPVVLIGEDTLTLGDKLSRYPDVMIDKITENSVVLKYKDQFFTIKLEAY